MRRARLERDACGGLMTRGRQVVLAYLAQPNARQSSLARRVGCSRAMISMVASGQRVPSTHALVEAFVRELGISAQHWHEPPIAQVDGHTCEHSAGAQSELTATHDAA